ncbi:MAG: hypothetical protein RSC25_07920, partial [Christensenella sp.]
FFSSKIAAPATFFAKNSKTAPTKTTLTFNSSTQFAFLCYNDKNKKMIEVLYVQHNKKLD